MPFDPDLQRPFVLYRRGDLGALLLVDTTELQQGIAPRFDLASCVGGEIAAPQLRPQLRELPRAQRTVRFLRLFLPMTKCGDVLGGRLQMAFGNETLERDPLCKRAQTLRCEVGIVAIELHVGGGHALAENLRHDGLRVGVRRRPVGAGLSQRGRQRCKQRQREQCAATKRRGNHSANGKVLVGSRNLELDH